MVGVEEDLHVVVTRDLVPVGEGRADARRILIGADAEVDRGRRVPHEHGGRIVGRTVVVREVLGEAAEHRGFAPYRLVQPSIDAYAGVDPSWHRERRG